MFDNQGGVWQVVSNVGGGVAVFAILSIALRFFGKEIRGFDLFDSWGNEAGIAIRVAMIIVGGLIWFLAKKKI